MKPGISRLTTAKYRGGKEFILAFYFKNKTFLDNHVGSFQLSNIKIEPFNNESAFRTTIEFLIYFLSSN